jgi:hypothetical protein
MGDAFMSERRTEIQMVAGPLLGMVLAIVAMVLLLLA